jgi:hypothetical protein
MPHTHAEKPKKAATAAKASAASSPAQDALRAAAVGGVEAQSKVLAPKPEAKAPAKAKEVAKAIALPASTEELLAHPEIKVSGSGSFSGKIPPDIGKLLVAGVAAEGVYDGELTAQAILKDYFDGGQVEALKVSAGGASYLWLKGYAGDTEVGYLFSGTKLSGIVSDGFISQL